MAEVSAENHKCVFCGQRFPSKPELQTHFRLHANGEIDIKGRPKVRHKIAEEDLNASKSTGTEDGTVGATGRSNGTATTGTTGKNNAMCDVCGEVFRTVSLAISHKFRKHPDSLLKHYCPHCGMMFPIKLNRDKHLLTHAGATPKQMYPCRPCGVTFYNQRAKKFHMDSAHKGAIRMVNPIRTPAPSMKIVVNNAGEAHSVYYCHLCGCEYQVKYNLQKHLATKHSEGEREALPKELVQCNLCSAVFNTKRAYEAHSHHHRDGDLFATNEQMRQQVVQRIDQDFDQRRVPTAVERYLSASAVSSNRSATWRRIQAARRSHTIRSTTQDGKEEDEDEEEEEEEVEKSQDDTSSLPDSLRMEDSPEKDSDLLLSDLSASKGEHITPGEDGFTQGEYLCWGTDDAPPRKKRMIDDSEEDDGEMRSLGTVNPDSVLSTQASRGVIGEVERTSMEDTEEEEQQRTTTVEGKVAVGVESGELMVEKVIKMREGDRGREFLARWQGCGTADDTWEQEGDLVNCSELMQEFMKTRSAKQQKTKSKEKHSKGSSIERETRKTEDKE